MSEFTKGLDSIVTVSLRPGWRPDGVTLRHSGLPDDKDGLDHKDAWIRILGEIGAQYPPRAEGKD